MGQVKADGRLDLSDARTYGGKVKPEHFLGANDVAVVMTDLTQSGELLGSPTQPPKALVDQLVISHHLQRFRCGDSIDSHFAKYLMMGSSWRSHVYAVATGTTVRAVSPEDAARFIFDLPPLAEQRAIAGLLGALDDKIESNRRIVDLAKKIISVEYEIAVNDTVDEAYEVRLEAQMGAPFKGENFSEIGNGRPLIRIRDLKTYSSQVWTTEKRADETVISRGDILVGMDAEFRSTIWLGDTGVLNQRMCRFVGRKGVSKSFAWLAIQPELEYCERAKSGTTVIHLNKSDIDRFRVPSLSDEEHAGLAAVTDAVFDRLVSAGREIASLSSLRDALLPELLSGRLRVRDAEKVVEGAV
jgi:type I restriction enzyme S subunit